MHGPLRLSPHVVLRPMRYDWIKNRTYMTSTKYLAILAIIFLGSWTVTQAQSSGTLKGQVTTAEGESLTDVNLQLSGTQLGTSTNAEGRFTISNIPAGQQQVVISRVGYQRKQKAVRIQAGRTTELRVSLAQTAMDLERVVLSGSPVPRAPIESTSDVNLITGANKFQVQSAGMGATVDQTPGVRSVNTGPQSSKPIIRGLKGKRIRLLHNSIGTDYQQYGIRHMPNMDPYLADRLEVVQGPASVLYGSNAMGGAINYQTSDVLNKPAGSFLRGSVISSYATNNNGLNTGIDLEGGTGNWGFEAKVMRRSGGDITTGDAKRFGKTGKEGDPKFTGELPNTDFEQLNGSASIGYEGDFGQVRVNYTRWQDEHNFLLPNGKGLGQRLTNQILQGQADFDLDKQNTLRTTFTYVNNLRQSAKGGTTRADMADRDDRAHLEVLRELYSGRVVLQHQALGPIEGQIGTEARITHQTTRGLNEPLVPGTDVLNIGAFFYEEAAFGPLTLSLGGRFDYQEQDAAANEALNLPADGEGSDVLDQYYQSLAGSFGANYRVTEELAVVANVGRGFRAPGVFDLHVDGQHGGIAAYQQGSPGLRPEHNWSTDLSMKWQSQNVRAEATVYQNWINDYIFLTRVPDQKGPDGQLPLYQTVQGDAELTGGYASVAWDVLPSVTLKGSAELVEGSSNGQPSDVDELPMIPANEVEGEIKYHQPAVGPFEGFFITAGIRHAMQKDAAGRYEPFSQFDFAKPFGQASTDAYTLFDAGIGAHLPFQGRRIHISVEGRNLMDEAYRNFLDTYKGYALSPGRNIRFKVQIPFRILNSNPK